MKRQHYKDKEGEAHILICHIDTRVTFKNGTMIPRATGSLPTQTLIPSHFLQSSGPRRVKERRGQRGRWRKSEQAGGATHRRHGDP